jgi:hypothetical protein
MWNSDDELFALMRTRLFPAVVGDILDTMGLLRQFLSASVFSNSGISLKADAGDVSRSVG